MHSCIVYDLEGVLMSKPQGWKNLLNYCSMWPVTQADQSYCFLYCIICICVSATTVGGFLKISVSECDTENEGDRVQECHAPQNTKRAQSTVLFPAILCHNHCV